MNTSARFAVIEILKTCEALKGLTEAATEHSKHGLRFPIDEDECEFLLRAMALMRVSVEALTPIILETSHQVKIIKTTPEKFVLHSV